MNEFEKFTCSLTTGDGIEIGSGIIVQIDLEELLCDPSCLEKKVHGKLSARRECYALVTAHSNVYEDKDCDADEEEMSVVQCLSNRKIVLINSDGLKTNPLDDSCVSCRAVSCCGVDSMLRMPQDLPPEKIVRLDFALKSHGPTNACYIGYNFAVVFLKDEMVRQCFPSHPPRLSLAQCSKLPDILRDRFEAYMFWRSDKGTVENEKLGIRTTHLNSLSQMDGLGNDVSYFEAYQSLQYVRPIEDHIGAPIFCTHDGESRLIGINTGNGMTTFYAIFKLLKGGVIPLLAAMRHPSGNARSLKPLRWKEHILLHLDTHMQSQRSKGRYAVDLLHQLLERDGVTPIVKFNITDFTDAVVAALNIVTMVLKQLKNGCGRRQCCDEIKCVKEFCSTDLKICLRQFAQGARIPYHKDMVQAMFECYEALLNYKDVAKPALERDMDELIRIATHEFYDTNEVVNKCCKKILLKEREYREKELKDALEEIKRLQRDRYPTPATD